MDLSNHFLIAAPALDEGPFAGSVVYLCEHNEEGAMGMIINKPSPIPMQAVFAGNGGDTPPRFADAFVFFGGPVHPERGFVVHTPAGEWQSTLRVADNGITTSRDIIGHLGDEEKVAKVLLTIGYASWEKGQLERELAENTWLSVAADHHILFDLPADKRYRAALAKLGIEQVNLMSGAGRA